MKKQIIIFTIFIILITTGLSGCEDNKPNNAWKVLGDTDRVELVSYKMETRDVNNKKIGNGFIHNSDAYIYNLTGTVKNIIGGVLNRVYIGVRYYDRFHTYLNYRIYLVTNLEYNATGNFTMLYTKSEQNFEKVDYVKFYLYVVME